MQILSINLCSSLLLPDMMSSWYHQFAQRVFGSFLLERRKVYHNPQKPQLILYRLCHSDLAGCLKRVLQAGKEAVIGYIKKDIVVLFLLAD